MSDFQFNEETGEWGYVGGIETPDTSTAVKEEEPLFLSKEEYERRQFQARAEQQQATAAADPTLLDDRPVGFWDAETPNGRNLLVIWSSQLLIQRRHWSLTMSI